MKLKRVISMLCIISMLFGMFTVMPAGAMESVVGESLSGVTSLDDFNNKFEIRTVNGGTATYNETGKYVEAALVYSVWYEADVRGKKTMPDNFSIRYNYGNDSTWSTNDVYFNYIDDSNYYGIVGATTTGKKLVSVVGGEEVVLASTTELGSLATAKDITIQKAVKTNGDVVIVATDNAEGGSSITVTDTRVNCLTGGTSRYLADARGNGDLHFMDWIPLQNVKTIEINADENNLRPVITATFLMDLVSVDATKIKILHKDTKAETDVEIISQYGNTVTFKPVADLAYSTDYYARFSKDIQTSVNSTTMIADKDILFTTVQSPIGYSNFKINDTDKNISDLKNYAGQTATISFDVYNTLSGITTGYLASVAIEKEGKMYVVGSDSQVADNTGSASMEIELDIPQDIPNDANCKIYIWDSQESMQSLYPFTSIKTPKENGITYVTDELNGKVTVTGNAGADAAYDIVTILVFNPKEDENATYDATVKNEVQYISEQKADQNGGFRFDITLNTSEYGFFNYYISSSGCTSAKSDKFYYATETQKNNATATINGKKDILTVDDINAQANVLGYNNSRYVAADKDFIVACIEAKLDVADFNETDAGTEIRTFINQIVCVSEFNAGTTTYLYGSENEFLFGELINLTDNSTYSSYTSELTETGRANVREYMLRKNAQSTQDIEDLFDEAVMLNLINNRKNNSADLAGGSVLELAEVYNLNISDYKNISNKLTINKGLMNYTEAFGSMDLFEAYLKRICAEYVDDTKYIDDSIYTYTFSEKDSNAAASDFTFEAIDAFNADHLYIGEAKQTAGYLSKNEFGGDYSYSANVYKSYNQARIMFNYKDSSNYYWFQIDGASQLRFGKVVNGELTDVDEIIVGNCVIATDEGSKPVVEATAKFDANTASITLTVDYDSEGLIRCSAAMDSLHKDAIVVRDSDFKSGKIGGRLSYTPGRLHSVTVKNYLSVTDGNILNKSRSNERIGINEDLSLYFNYDINPGTVQDNVCLEDSDGNKVSSSVELQSNNREIIIHPTKSLEYAQEYCVVVKEGITMNKTTTSVIGERRYKLKTNEPAFSVLLDTEFDGGAKNANEKIGFSVDVNNETGSSVEHIVLVVLKDKDGNLINAKAFKDIADTVTGEFTLELVLEAGGRLEYYVFNNTDSLKFVYPKQEVPTVDGSLADGDVYVIQNDNQINVIGYTKANDKVRMIVLDAGKTMENIADDDAVIYFSEFIADGTGRFEKVFTKEELGEGDHVLAIAPVSYSIAQNIMLKISADTAINESVGKVNLNQNTVESVVEVLGIDAKLADSLQSWSDIEAAVDREIATNGNFATDDAGKEIRSFVNEKLLLNAFNTGDKNVIFRNGEYMYNHIISIEDISTALSGTTSYEFYKSSMTDTGKGMVIDYLMNNNFASKEDLYKRFNEAVVLYGIKNCKMSGYGHIQNLLVQNGVHVNGLNIADYIAKRHSQTDYTIYNSTFSSISELNNSIIASIQEQPTVDRPTTSGGGGGGGIPASHITKSEVVPDSFSTACVFKDVKANMEWCVEAVNYLHEKEIILGDENGLFNPSNPITREEFIKIAVIAFELKNNVKTISSFADVVPGSWYENYIIIAVQNGAINGYPDGTVGVGQKITREEVAEILYRLIGDNNEVGQQVLDVFIDNTMVSEYAREALSYMVSQNIISGRGNNILAPKEVCTRAEAAKIVYEIIKPAEKED